MLRTVLSKTARTVVSRTATKSSASLFARKYAKKAEAKTEAPAAPKERVQNNAEHVDLPGIQGTFAAEFFELALQSGQLSKVEEELNGLYGMKESRSLSGLMEDPTIKAEDKKAIFGEVAKKLQLAPLTVSIMNCLFEAKREKFLWEVIKGFNVLLKTHRKEHSAVLYTKGALTPAKFSEYKEIIKQQHLSYDVNLNLEHKVDSTIVDGYRVVIDNDTTIDRTLNTEVNELVNTVKEEMRHFWDQKKRRAINLK
jgi:ATP synthase F1 delta subunit